MVVAFQLGGVISRVMAGKLDGTQLSFMLVTPVLFLLTSQNVCGEKKMLQKTSRMLLLGLLRG